MWRKKRMEVEKAKQKALGEARTLQKRKERRQSKLSHANTSMAETVVVETVVEMTAVSSNGGKNVSNVSNNVSNDVSNNVSNVSNGKNSTEAEQFNGNPHTLPNSGATNGGGYGEEDYGEEDYEDMAVQGRVDVAVYDGCIVGYDWCEAYVNVCNRLPNLTEQIDVCQDIPDRVVMRQQVVSAMQRWGAPPTIGFESLVFTSPQILIFRRDAGGKEQCVCINGQSALDGILEQHHTLQQYMHGLGGEGEGRQLGRVQEEGEGSKKTSSYVVVKKVPRESVSDVLGEMQ
jgi:hypothetical protein